MIALDNMERTRARTKTFIADLTPDQWFWCPSEMVTHIAWQVGHLAVAQYNLCLRRVRGRIPEDEMLVSDEILDAFKLGSVPVADPSANPSIETILQVFDSIHQTAMAELARKSDDELDVPVERPHPVFRTKLEAVEYCHQHELVHIGQIALLRRLMGKPPLR